MTENQLVKENVFLVLTNIYTKKSRIILGKNIVTDAGDIFYAQKISGEATTNPFDIMELGINGAAPVKTSDRSNVTTPVGSSQKVFDLGFPKSNDLSAVNTGKGIDVVTFSVIYLVGEANANDIDRVIITNATPGASEPVLMHASVTPFTKTSSDILQVFVNHTMNGV